MERCSFPDGPVNCAVSGGADSMALLALASSAGLEVTAIHVDHGIRPGSSEEADIVAATASALALNLNHDRLLSMLGRILRNGQGKPDTVFYLKRS